MAMLNSNILYTPPVKSGGDNIKNTTKLNQKQIALKDLSIDKSKNISTDIKIKSLIGTVSNGKREDINSINIDQNSIIGINSLEGVVPGLMLFFRAENTVMILGIPDDLEQNPIMTNVAQLSEFMPIDLSLGTHQIICMCTNSSGIITIVQNMSDYSLSYYRQNYPSPVSIDSTGITSSVGFVKKYTNVDNYYDEIVLQDGSNNLIYINFGDESVKTILSTGMDIQPTDESIDKTLFYHYINSTTNKLIDSVSLVEYSLPDNTIYNYLFNIDNAFYFVNNDTNYLEIFYFENNNFVKTPVDKTKIIPLVDNRMNGSYINAKSLVIGDERITIYNNYDENLSTILRLSLTTGEIIEKYTQQIDNNGDILLLVKNYNKILNIGNIGNNDPSFSTIGISEYSAISSENVVEPLKVKSPLEYAPNIDILNSDNYMLNDHTIIDYKTLKSIVGTKGYGGEVTPNIYGQLNIGDEGNIFVVNSGFGQLTQMDRTSENIDGEIVTLIFYDYGQYIITHNSGNFYLSSNKDLSIIPEDPSADFYSITFQYSNNDGYWIEISGNSLHVLNRLESGKSPKLIDVSVTNNTTYVDLIKVNTLIFDKATGPLKVSLDNGKTYQATVGIETLPISTNKFNLVYFNSKYYLTQNQNIFESTDGITFTSSTVIVDLLKGENSSLSTINLLKVYGDKLYFGINKYFNTVGTNQNVFMSIDASNVSTEVLNIGNQDFGTLEVFNNDIYHQYVDVNITNNIYISFKSILGTQQDFDTPIRTGSGFCKVFYFGNTLTICSVDVNQNKGIYTNTTFDTNPNGNWNIIALNNIQTYQPIICYIDELTGYGRMVIWSSRYSSTISESYVTIDGGANWVKSNFGFLTTDIYGYQPVSGIILSETEELISYTNQSGVKTSKIIKRETALSGVFQNKYTITCVLGENAGILKLLNFSNDSMIQFKKVSDNSSYTPTSFTYVDGNLNVTTTEDIELYCIFIGPKK